MERTLNTKPVHGSPRGAARRARCGVRGVRAAVRRGDGDPHNTTGEQQAVFTLASQPAPTPIPPSAKTSPPPQCLLRVCRAVVPRGGKGEGTGLPRATDLPPPLLLEFLMLLGQYLINFHPARGWRPLLSPRKARALRKKCEREEERREWPCERSFAPPPPAQFELPSNRGDCPGTIWWGLADYKGRGERSGHGEAG